MRKHSFIILLFVSFLLQTTAFSQDKKYSVEIGVGLFNVQGGIYRTLTDKSVVGVNGHLGFIFPAVFAQVSPHYKYYFGDYIQNKASSKGSFFAVLGMNALAINDMHAGSDNKWRLGVYANAGLGYEWNLRKFIIRPTLSVAIPFTKIDEKDGYMKTLKVYSAYSTLFYSLSVCYRF